MSGNGCLIATLASIWHPDRNNLRSGITIHELDVEGFLRPNGFAPPANIPYSKEENGIVERANKKVNRHIRNILMNMENIPNWNHIMCMTEKLLNPSVKSLLRSRRTNSHRQGS
jgi:hypothetical protein